MSLHIDTAQQLSLLLGGCIYGTVQKPVPVQGFWVATGPAPVEPSPESGHDETRILYPSFYFVYITETRDL